MYYGPRSKEKRDFRKKRCERRVDQGKKEKLEN
jgi:hypothetical protein